MTERKKTKVVTSNEPEKAEKKGRELEELESKSTERERGGEAAFESEATLEGRAEPGDDDEDEALRNEAPDASDDEEEENSGDAQCEAAEVEGEDAAEEEEYRTADEDNGNAAFARESSHEGGLDARVVYRNYSFRTIAGRPSGSHVFISDPAGDVHKAEPVDILGRRVLLVHKADYSDFAQVRFTDEPMA
jgi:hypothetical protein